MARKQAQGRTRNQLFERLRDLFAGFAHEVRNPLSTIGLNLALIKEDFAEAETPRDKRTVRRIEVLESEIKRLQSVLDEFLHFVRGPSLNPRPVQLNTLLGSLVEFMAPEAESLGISLRFYPDPELGLFDVDADMFRAMIVNLIRNAIQACHEGDQVLVSTLRQGGDVVIRVTDTGPGMAPEIQEHVFKPYFSTKKGGTGLGLPFVKRVVMEHGGTIHLSSEVGQGTQFVILLPSQRMIAGGAAAGGPGAGGVRGGESA